MAEIIELKTYCLKCKQEASIIYDHPEHGFVCEHCPEFSDGGISIIDLEEDE